MKIALLLLAAVSSPPQTEWAWHCKFDQKFACTPSGGCTAINSTISTFVQPSSNFIARCEGDDCNYFENMVVNTSGSYFVGTFPSRGVVLKIDPNLSITEVVTLGHTVITSYGKCEEGGPLVRTVTRPQQN